MTPPETFVEWLRLANAMLGVGAFALLTYRLVGRWPLMSWLSRTVTCLLAVAVLVMGLGAARAIQAHIEFNELAYLALIVNFSTVVVGVVWHRLLDPTGTRT